MILELREMSELPSFVNSRMANGHDGPGLSCRNRSRHRIRPIPFVFWGLIAAIVIWGMEYKLSLYNQHPAPSMRVQVAKLWLENRSNFVVPARTKEIPSDRTHLQAFAAPRQSAVSLVSVSWRPVNIAERRSPTDGLPIPSRSPPLVQLGLD